MVYLNFTATWKPVRLATDKALTLIFGLVFIRVETAGQSDRVVPRDTSRENFDRGL